MSNFTDKQKKIEETVVSGYKKVEDTVVGSYKKVEDTFVGGYKKIEDKFVETFLTPSDAASGAVEDDGKGSEQDERNSN